jgi:chorismate mutase
VVKDSLSVFRDQIDQLDDEIMHKFSTRMKISEKIGQYKKENNVTILQVNRWEEIIATRVAIGLAMGLSEEFMKDMLKLVHHESIQVHTRIMNKVEERV